MKQNKCKVGKKVIDRHTKDEGIILEIDKSSEYDIKVEFSNPELGTVWINHQELNIWENNL